MREQDDQRLVGNRNRKGEGEDGAVGWLGSQRNRGFVFVRKEN